MFMTCGVARFHMVRFYCMPANGFKTVSPLQPGGTVKDLEYRPEMNAEAYTAHALEWLQLGATIIGGCCEITQSHIRHLQQALLDRNILTTSF